MPDAPANTNPPAVRRPQQGAAVWRTADAVADPVWRVVLTDEQRDALAAAARAALASGVTPATIDRGSFALPGWDATFAAWSDALERGRGFLLIRRFPIDLLEPAEIELAYVGMGVHLGTPVSQTSEGELLTHIRDERLPESAGPVRLYRTRARQDFHTDGADIIGLLCLHEARSGGESKLVSSWAIYNEMLATRPDLLEELHATLPWDRQGDVPAGQPRWFALAPITELDGVPRLFYIGWYLRDSQQHADAPRLTDRQLEAMAMLESLANDPTFHLEMAFEPGDVQLVNNGRILHASEAYEDDPDPDHRRHLLRLWLAAHRFASLEGPLRDGVAPPARA